MSPIRHLPFYSRRSSANKRLPVEKAVGSRRAFLGKNVFRESGGGPVFRNSADFRAEIATIAEELGGRVLSEHEGF